MRHGHVQISGQANLLSLSRGKPCWSSEHRSRGPSLITTPEGLATSIHICTPGKPSADSWFRSYRFGCTEVLPGGVPNMASSAMHSCLLRRLLPLWKALAAHRRLAQKVITLLYMKLKLRPSRELIRPPQQSQLISLLVSSSSCCLHDPLGSGIIQNPVGSQGDPVLPPGS
jgi:hypothetical protein